MGVNMNTQTINKLGNDNSSGSGTLSHTYTHVYYLSTTHSMSGWDKYHSLRRETIFTTSK